MIIRSVLLSHKCLISVVTVLVGLAALANLPGKVSANEGERSYLSISAVGDVMMGSAYPVAVLPPNDGVSLFENVKEHLKGDIVIGNLEGPLVDGGEPQKCRRNGAVSRNCYEFSMPTRYAQHLSNAGFNVMNIANNHSHDFGEHGIIRTLETLAKAGIAVTGCGRIGRFRIGDRNVAVLGFTFSAPSSEWGSVLNMDRAKRIIRSAKEENHIVVVSFHGGAEGKSALHVTGLNEIFAGEHRGNVKQFARGAIDAGADLVIGHGPHVVRAMEVYGNKLIAYSLGNFLTYGMFNLKGPNGVGAILRAKIDHENGNFVSGQIVPVLLKQGGLPSLDEEKTAVKLIRTLTLEDLGPRAVGIGERGELYPIRQE